MVYYSEAQQSASVNEQFGTRFKDLFAGLFPSIPLMIATILAFIIVCSLLFYLVYKPIKKLMKERERFIQSNIDDSIQQKQESILKLNEANQSLKNAHIQADQIISKAKIKAEKTAEVYLNSAKTESKRLLEETNIDIANQKKQFDFNSRRYVVEIATELAEKILKREITQTTQDQIINQYLNTDKDVEEL